MEELKNNETSEKKERIDPLEVITLEGDENQVAEEKEDSPVIRRGDIYSFEDQEWRVFDVRDKNVNLINLKNNKLRLKDTAELITAIENRECVKIKEKTGSSFSISPEEMEETFDEIQAGRYSVEERSVLQLICNDKHLQDSPYALNEIAILKRDSSSMISIRTAINGAYLNTYQADGLVIATPTGSTAYSLSVGGPIMVPHSNTVVITPVAPHSLNVRPIVIRDDWEITLDVESRSHNFLVAIDGRSETCKETTQLTIRRADYSVKVVKRFNHIFFDTLRSKMMWGADGRR